jgi:hypothetical protein
MRSRSIVGVLAAVGLTTAFAARPSGAASTRKKMTCEEFRADAYDTPILEKMGCKAVECEITEQKTSCSCPVKGGLVTIATQQRTETYLISFVPMGSH